VTTVIGAAPPEPRRVASQRKPPPLRGPPHAGSQQNTAEPMFRVLRATATAGRRLAVRRAPLVLAAAGATGAGAALAVSAPAHAAAEDAAPVDPTLIGVAVVVAGGLAWASGMFMSDLDKVRAIKASHPDNVRERQPQRAACCSRARSALHALLQPIATSFNSLRATPRALCSDPSSRLPLPSRAPLFRCTNNSASGRSAWRALTSTTTIA
jgi:hypothetical protein